MHKVSLVILLATWALVGCASDSGPDEAHTTDAATNSGGMGAVGASGGTHGGGASSSGGHAATGGKGGTPGSGGSSGGSGGSSGRSGGSSGGVTSNGGAGIDGGGTGNGGRTTGGAPATDASTHMDAGPETGTHDAAIVDSAKDAGIVVAPPGTVRFVNVAPGAPALDVCMKPSSDSGYTGSPILAAHGASAGLPYQSASPYLDLGLDPQKFYDFEFVAASAHACTPPLYAAIGNRRFPGDASTTIAVYESQFTPVAGYNGAQIVDSGTPVKIDANLRFYYASQGASQTADFHATPSGGAESTWFSAVSIGAGTGFHSTAPGTYSFRVTPGGAQTTLAQTSGVNLTADEWVDAFLYPTSATNFSLLRCPSSASIVTACAP